MDTGTLEQKDQNSQTEHQVVTGGAPVPDGSKASRLWASRYALVFAVIFAGIGGYIILNSFASTVSLTKVWNTDADWKAGALNNVSVANNTVTLLSSAHTTSSTKFVSTGSITLSYDAGTSVDWTFLTPQASVLSGTKITYQSRTSDDNSSWSNWNSSVTQLANSRYIQIKATLSTKNSSKSPVLQALTLGYDSIIATPTATISASSTSITAGEPVILTWSSTNTTSCSASGDWSGTQPVSGTFTTPALNANSTFNIACSGAGGTANASVVVTVTTSNTTGGTTSSSGGCSNNGVVSPCIGNYYTGASGWGTPVFDDEFSGTTLDTTKWASSWFNGGSMNNVSTSPTNVAVTNGNLMLTLASASSGALVSTNPNGGAKPGFQFGAGYYAEARIYFPGNLTNVYNWPAFWTDGQNWPTDGEIDIAEGLGTMTSNYHSNSGANNSGTISGNWAGEYHIYAVDREAGTNYIYFDGRLIRSYATDDAGAPHYLILNVGSGNTAAYGTASQVKTDYVRVWKKQ